ncbi:MAG: thiamine-binding protein [Chloroflexi bacterium]|nr:thiamine-binding protein [Chloroflexota bacterium]
MSSSRTTVVGVQVLPFVNDPYPVVDKAIAAIQASGIRYIVTPMETVMEGQLEDCLKAARAAHEACFDAGVQKAVTIIKISDAVNGSTIDDKLAKYR